jgi:hypothetical protein
VREPVRGAGHAERVLEERTGVPPERALPGGERAEPERDRDRRDGERGREPRAPLAAPSRLERRGRREPDDREIRVAVGERLRADLHDADHRHEDAGEPQPADREMRSAREGAERERGRREERRSRAENRRRARAGLRVRIERREPERHEDLRDVADVRDGHVRESLGERQAPETRGRAARPLREERRDAAEPGERKEGDLLDDRRAERSGVDPPPVPREPAERPEIEEEERERKRHDDALGEEPEREDRREGRALPCAPRPAPAAGVHPHGQHPEEARDEPLPLRSPRDGLDLDRMEREDAGDEEAGERSARHAQERGEEEQCGRGVERRVRRVHGARREAGGREVREVGQPRDRDPVGAVDAGEGPADAGRRQPGAEMRVVAHHDRVVVGDVPVLDRRGVDGRDRDREEDREREPRPALSRRKRGSRVGRLRARRAAGEAGGSP